MAHQFLMLLPQEVNTTVAPLDAGTLLDVEFHAVGLPLRIERGTIGLRINGLEVLPDNFPLRWAVRQGGDLPSRRLVLGCFGQGALIEVRVGGFGNGARKLIAASFRYEAAPNPYADTPVRYHVSQHSGLGENTVQIAKVLNGHAAGLVADIACEYKSLYTGSAEVMLRKSRNIPISMRLMRGIWFKDRHVFTGHGDAIAAGFYEDDQEIPYINAPWSAANNELPLEHIMVRAKLANGRMACAPLGAIMPTEDRSMERVLWRFPSAKPRISAVEASIDPVKDMEFWVPYGSYAVYDAVKPTSVQYTVCIVEDKNENERVNA